MIPNMYKIAGEQLPCRIPRFRPRPRHARPEHLRRPAGRDGRAPDRLRHPLRQAPSRNVMDLAGGRPPGRHRIQSIPFCQLLRRFPHLPRNPEDRECIDYEDVRKAAPPGRGSRPHSASAAMTPRNTPVSRGTAQNPDVYFQHTRAHATRLLRRRAPRRRWRNAMNKVAGHHRPQIPSLRLRGPSGSRPYRCGHGLRLRNHRGSRQPAERPGPARRPREGPSVPSLLHRTPPAGHPFHGEDHHRPRSYPRNPAASASRCTSTFAPPSWKRARRRKSSAAATVWVPKNSRPPSR